MSMAESVTGKSTGGNMQARPFQPDAASQPGQADTEGACAEVQTLPGRILLVDGFNVLHAVLLGKERSGWWRRSLRERLLARATAWHGDQDEIWVAFDGARPSVSTYSVIWSSEAGSETRAPSETTPTGRPGPSPRRSGPIVHSLFVESADDWIVRRARRAEQPDRVVVVSNDRKVTGRARSAGCEILTPWAFIARCPLCAPDPAPAHASADASIRAAAAFSPDSAPAEETKEDG